MDGAHVTETGCQDWCSPLLHFRCSQIVTRRSSIRSCQRSCCYGEWRFRTLHSDFFAGFFFNGMFPVLMLHYELPQQTKHKRTRSSAPPSSFCNPWTPTSAHLHRLTFTPNASRDHIENAHLDAIFPLLPTVLCSPNANNYKQTSMAVKHLNGFQAKTENVRSSLENRKPIRFGDDRRGLWGWYCNLLHFLRPQQHRRIL